MGYAQPRRIVFDITYECNSSCRDCDRYCSSCVADESSRMSAPQVERVLAEFDALGLQWDMIRISGGEPILHPDFKVIATLLRDWARRQPNKCEVNVLTNGMDPELLKKVLPAGIRVANTGKHKHPETPGGGHTALRRVPWDDKPGVASTGNHCPTLAGLLRNVCSMCVNRWGYYLTSSCAGIDRIIGANVGLKDLRAIVASGYELLYAQQQALCKFCPRAAWPRATVEDPYGPMLSYFYTQYQQAAPSLTDYGGRPLPIQRQEPTEYWRSIMGWCTYSKLYQEIVEQAPVGATLVECGVFLGQSLCVLLEAAQAADKDLRVYGIDSFDCAGPMAVASFPGKHTGASWLATYGQGAFYAKALHNIGGCPTTACLAEVRREDSAQAARRFANESVYFCYIDAGHDYDSVLADLRAWWPKIQVGGWLAGHDLKNCPAKYKDGVRRALQAFCAAQRLSYAPWGRCSWRIKKK